MRDNDRLMILFPRARLSFVFAGLAVANLAAWISAIAAFHAHPILLGTAVLAYSLGLRHAVDADHIAAIDNVARKLLQAGRNPDCTGLYFSLGHSTIVILASVGIACGGRMLSAQFPELKIAGGLIGTSVSAFFLFAIAIANLFILGGVYRAFRQVQCSGRLDPLMPDLLSATAVLSRLFGPAFRLIRQPWHMYPLGLLFGLGFDTATEVGVLGISAAEAAKGLSLWSLLIFPALFTAGMALVDTLDSVLMSHAYGWAFIKPVRKLYYNLTLTAVSVLVALLVGSIEALGIVAGALSLKGRFWDAVAVLNSQFGTVGYVIIGVFALSWVVSLAIYHVKGFDDLAVETP